MTIATSVKRRASMRLYGRIPQPSSSSTMYVAFKYSKWVECAECAMRPNAEVRKAGDDGPFHPINNGIRTKEDVLAVLGLN